jgi:pseudouridylate synthase
LNAHFVPPRYYSIHPEVQTALEAGSPIVALESTVITHGLPFPENLQLAQSMEEEVRQQGAVPATIAVLDGSIRLGLDLAAMERLATAKGLLKISSRDYTTAVNHKGSGGTTVAATMIAAHAAGVHVFATGGIGGVHRQDPFDISADLTELARTPILVVCTGAKAILDLPATLERLETDGVPVVGYQTDEFPAFYAASSGLPVSTRGDSPGQVIHLALTHWSLGLTSAVLVVQPPPEESALPAELVQEVVELALKELQVKGIRGQAVTPFLLQRVSELTAGSSLKANLALLRNNARLAAALAIQWSGLQGKITAKDPT